MDFATDKPIYRQIVDYCYTRVISGAWKPSEKAPSVRELAVELSVNTHTVLKAYETLQDELIIAPRRGMGYYLAADAAEKVSQARRRDFYQATLPALRREMDLLGITPDELLAHLTSTPQ